MTNDDYIKYLDILKKLSSTSLSKTIHLASDKNQKENFNDNSNDNSNDNIDYISVLNNDIIPELNRIYDGINYILTELQNPLSLPDGKIGVNVKELQPINNNRKSFYGKAIIVSYDNIEELYSYESRVGRLVDGQLEFVDMSSSQTSRRHIREWLKQHDIELNNEKNYKILTDVYTNESEQREAENKQKENSRWEKFHSQDVHNYNNQSAVINNADNNTDYHTDAANNSQYNHIVLNRSVVRRNSSPDN